MRRAGGWAVAVIVTVVVPVGIMSVPAFGMAAFRQHALAMASVHPVLADMVAVAPAMLPMLGVVAMAAGAWRCVVGAMEIAAAVFAA